VVDALLRLPRELLVIFSLINEGVPLIFVCHININELGFEPSSEGVRKSFDYLLLGGLFC